VRHTGDVLKGQEDGGGLLEDLERIYVDLENCPQEYDCLAFEGNVFTGGTSFGDLESCYVRLVNADTNRKSLRRRLLS
jgi:stress response protein SCP2